MGYYLTTSQLPCAKWPMPVFSHSGQHIIDVDHAIADIFGFLLYIVNIIAWTRVDGTVQWWMIKGSDANPQNPGKLRSLRSYVLRHRDNPSKQAMRWTNGSKARLRFNGTVSYHHLSKTLSESRSHPRIDYIYGIELNPKLRPVCSDRFGTLQQYSFDQLWESLADGHFAPFTRMPLLAYFLKAGFLDPPNVPDLHNTEARMHRRVVCCEM